MTDSGDGSLDYAARGRYYRGHCEHGLWIALLAGDAAADATVAVTCPAGCEVELTTGEARP